MLPEPPFWFPPPEEGIGVADGATETGVMEKGTAVDIEGAGAGVLEEAGAGVAEVAGTEVVAGGGVPVAVTTEIRVVVWD